MVAVASLGVVRARVTGLERGKSRDGPVRCHCEVKDRMSSAGLSKMEEAEETNEDGAASLVAPIAPGLWCTDKETAARSSGW